LTRGTAGEQMRNDNWYVRRKGDFPKKRGAGI
jgi:hypothetical protein